MDSISQLISIMKPIEQKDFIRHLNIRNKRHDTRNIDLFKAIISNREEVIKNEIGGNAFNVLKKRLTDRLLDFMAGVTLESEATEEIQIIKQLLIGRKLFVHGKFELAFKVLNRAEKQSIVIHHYSLLNEIYHTYIQYSYNEFSPSQESLFKRFEENQNEFLQEQRLNMAYAVIRKAFNRVEHDSDKLDLNELLLETFERFNISDNQGYNFQSLFQLAQIADVSGAYSKDYHSIDLFFVNKVSEIAGGPIDNEKYLVYHIDVLYLISNIYFRKRMFKSSLQYLSKMYEQMERFDKRYYSEKLIQYNTLMALNFNYTGCYQDAIEKLNELFDSNSFQFNNLLNPYLVKAMIHFQQGELNAANKIVSQFNRTDSWYEKHIGLEWVLNKNYIEILLHIELGNIDYVDSRISALIRKYSELFKSRRESQVLIFLKLVRKYYQNPEIVTTDEFKKQVENSIQWKLKEKEDIILMSFYSWLKSKMENKPLYATTLELVKL